MDFKVLKRSHLKRNIIIGITTITILTVSILTFTKANFKKEERINLANDTIKENIKENNLVGIYINTDSGYTKTDTIPDGYVLNESESYCAVNGEEDTSISLSYDVTTKSLSVTPMTTQGTKCYLYFDEKGITNIQELIASKNLATRTDFSTTLKEDTTGTIYYADTSKGRTYYFAGNPTDNWVKFANKYWRIIRINEDGSLRLIYQGTSNTATGSSTQTETSTFSINSSTYNNNAYVGYMYTVGSLRGTTTDSGIKKKLDTWYQDNLSSYADKIDGNAGFCGDRTPSTSSSSTNNQGGTGTTRTYYGGYIRLITNKQPTFECPDGDLYTTKGSEDGNKALQYPIGLISADEVAYAGGVWATNNTSYYLYTGQNYWTMSPCNFSSSDGRARVFYVRSAGRLNDYWVGTAIGVRPVINLKSNIQFSEGNGTSETPLVVS